jgi:hypothetical protein
MTTQPSDLLRTLDMLRRDALDRGMLELAIAPGWSQIRVGFDLVQARLDVLRRGVSNG